MHPPFSLLHFAIILHIIFLKMNINVSNGIYYLWVGTWVGRHDFLLNCIKMVIR